MYNIEQETKEAGTQLDLQQHVLRLRYTCASTHADDSLICPHGEALGPYYTWKHGLICVYSM